MKKSKYPEFLGWDKMFPEFTLEKVNRLLDHVRFLIANRCLSQQNALELNAKTRQIHIKTQAIILK